MPWDDDLLEEQREAAAHVGTHARLLAGPGTGKTLTLTRRICHLITEKGVEPDHILAITFTRAAAGELRQRVTKELGADKSPRISTLHSFALRQLIKNAAIITALPNPLRIADDWDERNIIMEDIRRLLELPSVSTARQFLAQMSADWQSLTADDENWDERFPDPRFLAAWQEHRAIYGYTLRSELVYQLKRGLAVYGDFELESPIEYLLVDEYQDLNRCDIAIVEYIARRGVELFSAGDDDQSIYGFRMAHPEGIRRFPTDYPGAALLELQVCKRCDEAILQLGLFVAKQDIRRVEKLVRPESGAGRGEVEILRFPDQFAEAQGIAAICKYLIHNFGYAPHEILVLLRNDNKGGFSRPIMECLTENGIDTKLPTDEANPLSDSDGRCFLAFLRLAASLDDSLAWRTLLQVWCNGIGPKALDSIYNLARAHGESFAQTLLTAKGDPSSIPSTFRNKLQGAIKGIEENLVKLFPQGGNSEFDSRESFIAALTAAALVEVHSDDQRLQILKGLSNIIDTSGATSIVDLIRGIGTSYEEDAEEVEEGKVNILTMHRAKGLTAEAVVVAAAENEYIPGRAIGEGIDDERRLLYVSLTRAKHHLFVTYCSQRTGQQTHTGSKAGTPRRSLTQFLRDSPYTPKDGKTFISGQRGE